ncbi:hypothetical protein R69658_08034 [Paraburkholderia aspalathi]|uniref:Uncharacterized protein n=1 Tax=Paraburkholderia aspalathi TaxID=1324617 RepID=A0ABN7NA56_9BURK|nr:hypothetical protein R69658_08034 [Paraburkholderia aspalathi]
MGKANPAYRDAQFLHVSEVRQASYARLICLGEEYFLAGAFERTPLADMPLKRAPHAVGETIGMVFLQFTQQGDRLELRHTAQQRDNFALPDVGERIRPGAPIAAGLLRRQSGVVLDTPCRALTHAGLRGSELLWTMFASVHVEANLLVGNADSRHGG